MLLEKPQKRDHPELVDCIGEGSDDKTAAELLIHTLLNWGQLCKMSRKEHPPPEHPPPSPEGALVPVERQAAAPITGVVVGLDDVDKQLEKEPPTTAESDSPHRDTHLPGV